MIAGLKPYLAMKDSGVEWFGEVPEHWDIERGKWLFTKMERSVQDADEVVTCFRDGIVTLRKNRRITGFTESLKEIGYQRIQSGDLVIHAMDAFAGAVGVSDSDGKGTPVYSVCKPVSEANAYYYAFMVREMARSQWILALAKGIRERSTDFRFAAFAMQPLPLPPLPEQAAIVRFLNHADRRIRRYIRAKQKLTGLLEEQKQAIIHRAVTRGLDADVPLKPSGVEWLGDVPAHWEVLPIKRAFLSMDYGISESATDNGTIRLLTMGNIKDGVVSIPSSGGVSTVDSYLLLQPNDLLFNRTNSAELVGKVGLFTGADTAVTFASYLVRMRPSYENNPDFLNILLNDFSTLSTARREAIPSLHQSNLNPTRYGRLHIALPRLEEQVEIVRFLRRTTSGPSAAINRTHQEIELLREYRTRLIADVVTGKLDVREATAQLPDEADELEPLEEDALNELAEDTADDLNTMANDEAEA
jgi:type I restriction enzyme S subunit